MTVAGIMIFFGLGTNDTVAVSSRSEYLGGEIRLADPPSVRHAENK